MFMFIHFSFTQSSTNESKFYLKYTFAMKTHQSIYIIYGIFSLFAWNLTAWMSHKEWMYEMNSESMKFLHGFLYSVYKYICAV